MALTQEFDNLQSAIRGVLRHLLCESANAVSPRGLPTHEVIGAGIKIIDPRNRLVLRPTRKKWSPAFAMAEYLWYMRGENEVDALAFYVPGIRAFSDDEGTLNSAYGYRIFGSHRHIGFNQWEQAKRSLREDPDTRQAVIHIRTPQDALLRTKDHPCTIALQFLKRSGKLSMISTMRSNDVILGTSYDVFSFTMMQEQMAFELGLELGYYYHQVGSWHIYDDQIPVAEQMVEMDEAPHPMPPLEAGLDRMVTDEKRIRSGLMVDVGEGYWRDWRLTLAAFAGLVEDPQLAPGYREAWQMGVKKRTKPRGGSPTRGA
jgi:thymidylate synthase